MPTQPPRFRIGPALGEAFLAVAFVLGAFLVLVLVAIAIHQTIVHSRPRLVGQLRWYLRRGTVRGFAQAVSSGDTERAETSATRLLAPAQWPRRSLPGQVRSWDEHAVRDGDRYSTTAEFRTADGLGAWCPTYARTNSSGLEVVRLGRTRALELTVLSRSWLDAGCVIMTAEIDGAAVYGQALLRPLIERNGRESVELWVHLEGRLNRRTMRKMKRVTRRALKRWAIPRDTSFLHQVVRRGPRARRTPT